MISTMKNENTSQLESLQSQREDISRSSALRQPKVSELKVELKSRQLLSQRQSKHVHDHSLKLNLDDINTDKFTSKNYHDKVDDKTRINYETDDLEIAVSKIARKLSPKSFHTNRHFFMRFTCYDVFLATRYKLFSTKARITAATFILFMSLFVLIVFIGASLEKKTFSRINVSSLYRNNFSCVLSLETAPKGLDNGIIFRTETIDNSINAVKQGEKRIAHCGECGKCSTQQ